MARIKIHGLGIKKSSRHMPARSSASGARCFRHPRHGSRSFTERRAPSETGSEGACILMSDSESEPPTWRMRACGTHDGEAAACIEQKPGRGRHASVRSNCKGRSAIREGVGRSSTFYHVATALSKGCRPYRATSERRRSPLRPSCVAWIVSSLPSESYAGSLSASEPRSSIRLPHARQKMRVTGWRAW